MKSDLNTMLFDLDGTLLDTAPDLINAINITLKQHNKPAVDLKKLRPYVSLGSPVMLHHSFGIHVENPGYHDLRQQFLNNYRNNIAIHTALFPGMQALLDNLNQQDIRWGIVTNKPTDLTEQLLKHFDFMRDCQCIICGDTLPVKKPDPAPLLHACQLLNIKPENTIYIGDSENDIIAANAAHMISIAVSYGYYPSNTQPNQWHADVIADTPNDIITWLNQHRRNTYEK
jgi:N-acetyl-D-muramate 6-phosphate phosphatase